MRSTRSRSKSITKVNVIPILDAVFIFIFFLLMSAQFLEIRTLGTDAPAIQAVDEKIKDKDPLNLQLIITSSEYVLKKGLEEKVIAKFQRHDFKEMAKLNVVLTEIKKTYYKEQSIILRPQLTIPYEEIVQIIDVVSFLDKKNPIISITQKDGSVSQVDKLFDQIVFETM